MTLQSSLPAQVQREQPVIFEDALGRVFPVHLEFIGSWEVSYFVYVQNTNSHCRRFNSYFKIIFARLLDTEKFIGKSIYCKHAGLLVKSRTL